MAMGWQPCRPDLIHFFFKVRFPWVSDFFIAQLKIFVRKPNKILYDFDTVIFCIF